jgi:hypothetical protein
MVKIYVDTNVLRYFGTAFSNTSLGADLQGRLVLAPLALLELLGQLGTAAAEEAFVAVQSLRRFDFEMLPWPEDFFRISLFGLPPRGYKPNLDNAVANVQNAAKASDLGDEGEEMRALYDDCKFEAARSFSALLESFRSKGSVPEEENRAIFAHSVARRAGCDEATIDVDFIVRSLDAYYMFGNARMRAGTGNHDYNVVKRSNDVYDEELLLYLAHPGLHLLTSDKGFHRAKKSSQADRIHIADAACLKDAACGAETVRSITAVSATT